MSGIDISGLEQSIMNKAEEAARNKVYEIRNSMQNFFDTMEINDHNMSKDNQYDINRKQISFEVVEQDSLHYSIECSIPDGYSDNEKEAVRLHVENTIKYVKG